VLVRTWDVLVHCYAPPNRYTPGRVWGWTAAEATPAQRKAAVRAMHSFVRRHQRYALAGGKGRKELVLYEPDDPLSAMWAKLTVERSGFVARCKAEVALKEQSS
jgi:hypothetical protein